MVYVPFVLVLLCNIVVAQESDSSFKENYLGRKFPIQLLDEDIRDAISTLTRYTDSLIKLDENLRGTVTVQNSAGTVENFLDLVAEEAGALWWFDGAVVTMEPQNAVSSVLIATGGYPENELRRHLSALGLAWPAFPIRVTEDDSLARISGPPSYLDQVSEAVERLVGSRGDVATSKPRTPQPNFYFGTTIQAGAAAEAAQ